MPRIQEDDWSDSDDEAVSGVETSVLLGVPDGFVDVASDLDDAAVSRIGGHPALLPYRELPLSSSYCKVCSNPTELLVQLWCPFEDSPMDRALYIWGCSRTGCQGKEGSVRAWRGLRHNEKYAAKLSKKLARKRELDLAKAAVFEEAKRKKQAAQSNPFSMSNNTSAPSPFGLGAQIFGGVTSPQESLSGILSSPEIDNNLEADPSDTESDSGSSEKSLLTAMAATNIAESPWKSAPSYPPLYLSTVSEYLPPQPKLKFPPGAHIEDPPDDDGKSGKDASWAHEIYENSLDVDHIFERFTKRVGYEGEQCIRYELNGTPLPFASDSVFDFLFPAPAAPPLPVTKAVFTVVRTPKRSYNPSSVPICPLCKAKRVFECQLMPNLINVLRPKNTAETKKLTDEERRREVAATLKRDNAGERRGMEWGTCLVFSCERDCCVRDDGGVEKECWREEFVLIHRDTTL